MANKANQKLRLLYLLKLFLNKTTEDSGLTTAQLLDELANVGIDTERKSLYRDFNAMREFGLVIEQNRKHEWCLRNRPFTQDELVMLVDSVQSTPFLTKGMSETLIGKLRNFASDEDRERLDGRIDISEYVKMTNEDVFWNISTIQKSAAEKRKVAFKYFMYVAARGKPKREFRHEHLVIPLRLVYADEKYYLLAYDERFEDMTPYRVDRMYDVVCSDEPIPKKRRIATWRMEDEVVLSFGVFGSKVEPITLDVRKDRLDAVIDKFGPDIDLYDINDNTIRVHVKAPLSPQFFGWMLQLGNNVKLASPKKAIDEFRSYCTEVLSMYQT